MPENVVQTEILINGAWTDYSTRPRATGAVTITRGLIDQQSTISPQTADSNMNNADGLLVNRNPLSPLYGLLSKYTQIRHSVMKTGVARETHVFLTDPNNNGNTMFTADKASLDVVGDIDVRIEITPPSWRPAAPQALTGKYIGTGNQRSWHLRLLSRGALGLVWSADGINGITSESTASIDVLTSRLAVRVVLDVNNGAAGNTTTFYTAPSLAGPWTVLGAPVVKAGVTSIFSSTAVLEVGSTNNGAGIVAGDVSYTGRIHGFQMYNSAAALVADMNPQTQAPGTTSWADTCTTPNTWSTFGAARLTSDNIRYAGEVPSWPTEWDVTGRDVMVPIRAQGALGRIMRGGQPLLSPLRRHLALYENVRAYFPMEAANGALKVDSASTGAAATLNLGTFSGSTPEGLPGSAGALTLPTGGYVYLYSPVSFATTGEASFLMYFKLKALPAADRVFCTLVHNGSGFSYLDMAVGPTGYSFTLVDSASGSTVSSDASLFGTGASPLNQWIAMQVVITQSGANINWLARWHAVGSGIFYSPTIGGLNFAGTVGMLRQAYIRVTADAALADSEYAHAMLTQGNTSLNSANFTNASKAFIDETAANRIKRLCEEEDLDIDLYGDPDDTEMMGAQTQDTTVNLLTDAQAVDGGALSEARDRVGFMYVSRRYMGDQYGLQLTYHPDSHLAATPKPTDDDRYLLNDVTASSPAGSAARYILETGPNSILAPPNGVNRVAGSVTRNVADDDQLAGQAQYEVAWRTWDGYRIPNMVVNLNRTEVNNATTTGGTSLRNALVRADVGNALQLYYPPAFMPPDITPLIIFGYTERIDGYEHTITYNTVPFGPFQTKRFDSGMYPILDSADGESTLNGSISITDTSLVIKVVGGVASRRRWIDTAGFPTEFPLDIKIGGEHMLMTACTAGAASGSDWHQVATVTRSLEGNPPMQKLHLSGSEIRIYYPAYFGLGA